jgi:GH18 family chitinase
MHYRFVYLTILLMISINGFSEKKTNFVPLPDFVICGYWENWGTAIKLTVIPAKYNVINISFMLTESDDYTPTFSIQTDGYTVNDFKNDIQILQGQGRPVVISIGGATGHVIIDSEYKKNVFVNGVIDIIDEYGFDGLDIDMEGVCMDFDDENNPGSFEFDSLSTKLQYTISAFQEIHDHYGNDFILTSAPEVAYVQGGTSIATDYCVGFNGKAGSFLPVIDNLRDRLDILQVQYYNFGNSTWIPYFDNGNWISNGYAAGSANAILHLADILLSGFNVKFNNDSVIHFDGFPQEKVAIGMLSTPDAGGSMHYINPDTTKMVLDYLIYGINSKDPHIHYTLENDTTYPNLHGMMTWSINCDKDSTTSATGYPDTDEYEFCYNYYDYFDTLYSNKYSIEGSVFENSLPLQNVTVSLSLDGDVLKTTATNNSGYYKFTLLNNGDYSLTFTKNFHSFSPNNVSVTISDSSHMQSDIAATFTGSHYNITGNIKDYNNNNLDSVIIEIISNDGYSSSDTTGSNGNYQFISIKQNDTYTITPGKVDHVFNSELIQSLSMDEVVNFTSTEPTTISGLITENGIPFQGATIRISNISDIIISNVSGEYTSGVLTNGTSYMVTPVKSGFIFDPPYYYFDSIQDAREVNFVTNSVSLEEAKRKIVYYYSEWSVYTRDFHVHEINADYLTHINYSFLMPFIVDGLKNIDDDISYRSGKNGKVITVVHTYDGKSVGLAITDPNADIYKHETGYMGVPGTYPNSVQDWLNITPKTRGVLGQLIQLREQQQQNNRSVKIMASIGGWTMGQHLPEIALEENYRESFGLACKKFLDVTGFDGVDLDWEFPVNGGTDGTETIDGVPIPEQPHYTDPQSEPVYFLKLLKNIREEIGIDYLLTIASAQVPQNIVKQFIWPGSEDYFETNYSNIYNREEEGNILDYLDFVNTMTYDYGGFWCTNTAFVAPLYNSNNPNDISNQNRSVSALIDSIISPEGGNAPSSKIVMGIPFYGKVFSNIEDGGTHGKYQGHDKTMREKGSWEATVINTSEISTTVDYADLKVGKALSGSKHQFLNNPSSGYIEYWDTLVKSPFLFNADTKKWIAYDDDNSILEKVKIINSKYLGGAMVWEITQDTKEGSLTKVIYNQIQQGKFKISGEILDNNNNGISGVSITLSNDGSGNLITDNSGYFEFQELDFEGDYTVNISKTDYVFLDSLYSFIDLKEDGIINAIGSNNDYSISGSVYCDSNLLSNVSVELYVNNKLRKTISSSDGNYTFTSIPGGFDYKIRAIKDYYSYDTTCSDINISNLGANIELLDFSLERDKHRISGYVKNTDGDGVFNIEVFVSGDTTDILTTDTSGFFETNEFFASHDYTITPIKEYNVFTPSIISFSVLNKNETCNFLVREETIIYGYVKDDSIPIENAEVMISLDWFSDPRWQSWSSQGTKTDSAGYYEFRNGPDTVTNLSVTINRTVTPPWPGTIYDLNPSKDTSFTVFSGLLKLDYNTQLIPAISTSANEINFGVMDTTTVIDSICNFIIKNAGYTGSILIIDSLSGLTSPFSLSVQMPDTIETVNDSLVVNVTFDRSHTFDYYNDTIFIFSGGTAIDSVITSGVLISDAELITLHVNVGGLPSGMGAYFHPFQSIQSCLESFDDNITDTIHVFSGVYNETGSLVIPNCIFIVDIVTIISSIKNNGTIIINENNELKIEGDLNSSDGSLILKGKLELQ